MGGMVDESDRDIEGVREALRRLAAAVDDGGLERAAAAYEDARVDGLCHEGAWERALEVMRAAADPRLNHQHGSIGLGDDQAGQVFQ
jgi:hypothetical protein